MSSRYDLYRSSKAPVPRETWAWNMYGPGVESIGRDGKPERFPVPEPTARQLLVRVDAVGLCFSDVKVIQQGGRHPRLHNRDLAVRPTRLGHEVALTVMKVGAALRDQCHPGQRLALQPDIYCQGKGTAYGYAIPGGLTQFHLIGPQVLDGDAGSYVLPVAGDLGYAEIALTEPWACVEAAYTQRRRLAPKPGGTMWILGRPGDAADYEFSSVLDAPATVVTTDVPPALLARVKQEVAARGAMLVVRDGLSPTDYSALRSELTAGGGFDDIVLLDPRSAQAVSQAAKLIARRGTLNLIGRTPLDGHPLIDVGRIHYDYTAYLGHSGPDIAAAYGETRNRCGLRPSGVALVVGAGGPMGQMHVQRAIEIFPGPALILATDINAARLASLAARFGPLAQQRRKRLVAFNPSTGRGCHPAAAANSLRDFVMRQTGGRGADDVVVCVPSTEVIAEAAQTLSSDGMFVLFAGMPNGTLIPLNLSAVYLHSAQFTGTSGSTLADQRAVIRQALAGELSPNQSVAAVGGIEAALDGIRAVIEGRYPGKVVIFPQISGLPLTGLPDLRTVVPAVAERLAPGDVWTREAEAVLIELLWEP
jgi:threonine dehydrogenase-like Zn-dependent dehydrogenase